MASNISTARSVAGHPHGRVPRAVREQQLIETATKLFADRGYQGTSIEDIASAAGVTRPIIYDHFGSKDGIYLACVRDARAELERRFTDAATEANDPGDQLWRGINAYFEFIERDPSAWDVLFGAGTTASGRPAEEVTRLRFSTVERIAELIAPSVSDADPQTVEALAHALSGSAEQLAKWWRRNPHMPREQIAGYHMAFAWIGLRDLVTAAQGASLDGAGPDPSPDAASLDGASRVYPASST
jgi:AcrR family transcriptional regulator